MMLIGFYASFRVGYFLIAPGPPGAKHAQNYFRGHIFAWVNLASALGFRIALSPFPFLVGFARRKAAFVKRKWKRMTMQHVHGLITVTLVLFLLQGGVAAHAQDAKPDDIKIEPDRRDFTVGTSIVPLGHVQIESGLTGSHRGAERINSYGEVLIRVPVGERVEFRFGAPSFLRTCDAGGKRDAGADDAQFEVRARFRAPQRWAFALTLGSLLPTGSLSVAERRWQPRATFAANAALSKRATLLLNLGAAYVSEEKKRFNQWTISSSFRWQLPPRLETFAEAYMMSREEAGGSAQKFLAAGLVYYPSSRVALDARVGSGLNNYTSGHDHFSSAGISFLF